MHERSVEWYRIKDLHLVSPPVREGRTRGAVLGHCISHFVSLEDVLQRSDRDVVLFQQSEERKNLVLAITMTMNPTLSFENLGNRIQFQVASAAAKFFSPAAKSACFLR